MISLWRRRGADCFYIDEGGNMQWRLPASMRTYLYEAHQLIRSESLNIKRR